MIKYLFCLIVYIFSGLTVFGEQLPKAHPRAGRVLVVANVLDPASMELARQYMYGYRIPPANLLRIPFEDQINIREDKFKRLLLDPIQKRLQELPDTVDYIAFMRGVPYRLDGKTSVSTAVMFGGQKNIPPVNPYYQQEIPFDSSMVLDAMPLLLPTFITGYTFADTQKLIKNSRVTYPSAAAAGTFYLCEGKGPRGTRKVQIDGALLALKNYQARGVKVPGADVKERMDILGQFTGAPRLNLKGNRYLPGSIVDNMTSWGGYLLDPKNQMSILSFIQHGACGAYGTVSEPTNSWRRWADFSLPARYASGFNLAESYYQTVADWRFGLVVGDPLMSPFSHPVSISLVPEDETVAQGAGASVNVTLKEGRAGAGLGSAEFWLNDQVKLLDWQPMLPVGTVCGLRIKAGEKVLVEKNVTIAEEAEPLGNVLDAFTGNIGQAGKVVRGGRRGEKLLFRLLPLTSKDGKIIPVHCEFSVRTGDEAVTTSARITGRPVMAHAAVLDFGSAPPVPGDKITVKMGTQSRSAQAFSSTTMEDILKKLVQYMNRFPELKADGNFVLKVQKIPVTPPRYQLVILPKDLKLKKEFPLSVIVKRKEKSNFARKLGGVDHFWRDIAIGGFAQTSLTPKLPVGTAAFAVDIPAKYLYPGPHYMTCVASTPEGTETVAETTLTVLPRPGDDFSARFAQTTCDPAENLIVYLKHGTALQEAWPKLVVDGMVVCAWEPGTLVGEFILDSALVCPGPHQVWIEWSTAAGLPASTGGRSVLARSAIADIFVRHPLAAGVELEPDSIEAGAKSVRLSGPYLSEGIRVMTEGKPLFLTRNTHNPSKWNLDISRLSPGVYQLSLVGDAKTDRSGIISTPLAIRWREPKVSPEEGSVENPR